MTAVSVPLLMAQVVAALTTTGGPVATSDPVVAGNNRPCLLVVPPGVDYTAGTFTEPAYEVRVVALAAASTWGLDATNELSDLIEHAATQLPELARATPTRYALTESQTVPAYMLTYTTL